MPQKIMHYLYSQIFSENVSEKFNIHLLQLQ